ATRGGIGVYTRATGWSPISTGARVRLAVGMTGEARDTAACVAHVAAVRAATPAAIDRVLASLGALAQRAAGVLAGEVALGAVFAEAQTALAGLGLSSPAIERLAALARAAGAHGAKLTGAGRGGAVIAVGRVDEVVSAWRAHGFTAFATELT